MRSSIFAVFLTVSLFAAAPVWAAPADYVFTNARVYTVNEKQPWAEAVAVKDIKIVYVGDAKGAAKFAGKGTEQFDLKGKMVLPGFVSGHDHMIASAWTKVGLDLFAAETGEDYRRLIKEYAEANPDLDIVIGYGWEQSKFGGFPTAKDLDALIPDRPALFFDYTIHDAWLNSKALEAANITRDTPDPQPGFSYWRRDAEGNPEGVAIEASWLQAYIDIGAWKPEIMMSESQHYLYQKAAESGLTAVIVPGLITPNLTNLPEALRDFKAAFAMLDKLDKDGKLQLRTSIFMIYKSPEGDVDELVNETLDMRKKYDSDRLRVGGIKIHPEGNWMTKTSLQLEPFLDGDKGSAGLTGEKIREIVLAGNKAGLDVITHVDGSATVRATVDATEASRKAGNTDARNTLQHYHLVDPADHERVVKMGLPVNVTPVFSTDWENQDEQAFEMLGKERVNAEMNLYPDAVRRGVKVSLSADIPSAPVELIGPLYNMETAITLLDPNNADSKPFPLGKKGLTLEQAIKGVTIFPAWQMRMEDKIGTLEVGKYADLVILEKNLFDVDTHDVTDVKVMGTMMGGKFTHRDGI